LIELIHEWLIQQITQNDVFAGIVGGSLLLTVFYALRSVPDRIIAALQWRFTSTVTVFNDDPLFDRVNLWLSKTPYAQTARRMHVVTASDKNKSRLPDYNNDKVTTVLCVPGFGRHFIWYEGWPFTIERKTPEGQEHAQKRREDIRISTWGINSQRLRRVLSEIAVIAEDVPKLNVYFWTSGYWDCIAKKHKRALSSIILPQQQKDRIISDIRNFLNSEDWFNQRGLPYRRGFLLKGAPGCGKTSLVMVLAGYFNLDLYVLNMGSIMSDSSLFEAILEVPDKAILLIEDIDAISATNDRASKAKKSKATESVTMSGFLNAIDGAVTRDGRILIMTTNYPDKIDSAVIRPGRADMHEEINPLDAEHVTVMCRLFMPDDEAAKFSATISVPIPAAELQEKLLQNMRTK